MKFIIATGNPKKLIELNRILNPLGIDAITAKEASINLEDVEETGKTFEENAKIKARAAAKLTNLAVVADDTGLCVDALDGAPGVYTARYAGENATDQQKYEKLLNALKGVPHAKRTAHFSTCICCILPNKEEIIVSGRCDGYIAEKPHGTNGFGYDPVFELENGKSLAELTAKEKDKISHRGNALRNFKAKLQEKLAELN